MYKKNNERRSIPLRVRFEVFKRDNFTCQYCGRKAPDVILEIEHIVPVAKGGDNDPTNLITACKECNSGKSDTLLNDNTLIESQYREIIIQNENIKKVKKMHLLKLQCEQNKEIECKILEEDLLRIYGIKLDEYERKKIKQLIKNYGILQIFDSLENLYFRNLNDEMNIYLLKRQIKYDLLIKEKEYLKDVFYIRKILINRFKIKNNITKNQLLKYIKEKVASENYDIDMLIRCAKDCWKLEQFYKLVEGNKPEGKAS